MNVTKLYIESCENSSFILKKLLTKNQLINLNNNLLFDGSLI